MSLFNGCGVALVTPFDKNGNVDFETLDCLLTHVTRRSERAVRVRNYGRTEHNDKRRTRGGDFRLR